MCVDQARATWSRICNTQQKHNEVCPATKKVRCGASWPRARLTARQGGEMGNSIAAAVIGAANAVSEHLGDTWEAEGGCN